MTRITAIFVLSLVSCALCVPQPAPIPETNVGSKGAGSTSATNTSTCYDDPTNPSCATFTMADDDAATDLQSLCNAMPYMVGCSLWTACKEDTTSGGNQGNDMCNPFVLVATICYEMGSMKGCSRYNALCQTPGTVVEQCTKSEPIPNALSTNDATNLVISMCSDMSMVGCEDCTSRTACPHPLDTMSKLCLEMPGMAQCAQFSTMCASMADNTAFQTLCGTNPNSDSLPPMKMWLHSSIRGTLVV